MASQRDEPSPLPLLRPMLPVDGEPFDSPDHLFEIKWDGARCLAYVEGGAVRLRGSRGGEMTARYPELGGLVDLPDRTIVDGEVVVLREGRPSFVHLQQREQLGDPRRVAMVAPRMPATFVPFDLLYLGGRDLLRAPLEQRRAALHELLGGRDDPHVLLDEPVRGAGVAYFEAARNAGLEGVVGKRLDSIYQPGRRSPDWVKVIAGRSEVFTVIGYVPDDDEASVKSLLIGEPRGRGWTYKGRLGSGFTDQERRELRTHLEALPPLEPVPDRGPAGAVWRTTGLRCRVRYKEKTVVGLLRGAAFEGWQP